MNFFNNKLYSFFILPLLIIVVFSCGRGGKDPDTGSKDTTNTQEVTGENQENNVKAEGPTKLTVLNNNHDFGKFKVGEIKSFAYQIKNEGSHPFVFETSPKPNCDCVSTTYYPSKPIPPGATDSVVIKYTSKSTKLGTQKKMVRIVGNSEPKLTLLHLTAEVHE